MKPILAKAAPTPAHCRAVDIDRPISLVRLTTQSGLTLDCAAETVFALRHLDGAPVILPPVPPVAKPLDWETPYAGGDDPRLWYIAGLMLANGRYTGSPSIPAQVALPNAPRAEADRLWNFLCDFDATLSHEARGRIASPGKVAQYGTVIRVTSRLIDLILRQACGGVIAPMSLLPNMEMLCGLRRASQDAFASGLIRGSDLTAEGKTILHRSAPALRAIHAWLFGAYGIPTSLFVNRYYGEFMKQTGNTASGHRLLLKPEHFGFVTRAGLSVDVAGDAKIFCCADPLADVKDFGAHPAIELHCESEQCVVGGFVLGSEFVVPGAAIALATMEEVLN